MGPPSLFIIVSILITSACAQSGPTSWTAIPFNPPAFPLAVKTPYVNTWVPQGNEPKVISNVWTGYGSGPDSPTVWQVNPLVVQHSFWYIPGKTLQWFTIITVDGTPYRLMGTSTESSDPVEQVADQIAVIMTPTRTSFLFQAGPVIVNATYLSPVEVC